MREFLGLIMIATALGSSLHGEEGLVVHENCVLDFASVEEGRAALSGEDRFTRALSLFDLECRLATNQPVSARDLRTFAAEQVMAWSEADREKLTAIATSVRDRLSDLSLPLPKTIVLIQTTGREEGNAAYTRGNAIVFPQAYVAYDRARLERIFIHELFHVLSSHNPAVREKLYAIIHFSSCPEITLDADLAQRKITNPDGPTLANYIELEVDDQPVKAVPFLFSPRRYDANQGGTIFDYLQFRLLAVQPDGDRWVPVMRDETPWMLDPAQTQSYHEQIGRNTTYIIHPDEVLADNFVHLAMKTPDLPSPWIIDQLGQLLRK